jgi:hypothetical protein
MSKLRALKDQILVDGQDLKIDNADVTRIRSLLPPVGPISADDLKVLVEMRMEARVVCEAFDKLLFPELKKQVLEDGQISQSEQFMLLRMLYGGGGVDAAERQFLQELRGELHEVTPEFETLYQDAMRA